MASGNFKVLAVCGSQRTGSYNQKLLKTSLHVLTGLGIDVSTVNVPIDGLPLFSSDLPVSIKTKDIVKELRSQFATAQGLLVCSPEFNGSMPPFLKNVIDWMSLPLLGDSGENVFKDKVVCLLGAARGSSTCLHGLAHLSSVFGHLGAIVVPQFYGISQAEKAISDTGDIVDAKIAANLKNYLNSFSCLLKKF